MKATKRKIIKGAISQFNQLGLANVRLQHIADEVGISVGNLAYHFSNKDAIKHAIVRRVDMELAQIIEPILLDERTFSHLIDFDNQLSSYYALLNQYAFYFLDLLELERAYPILHIKRKKYIERMVQQIGNWIHQHAERGTFKPEFQANQYNSLAHTIWMIITFWLTQQKVRGIKNGNEGAFKEAVWNQLLPIFTTIGLMEYEAIILPQLKLVNSPDFY